MATLYEQILEKKAERAKLADNAKRHVRDAEENGGWKGEDEGQHKQRMADLHKLTDEIKGLEDQYRSESDNALLDSWSDGGGERRSSPERPGSDNAGERRGGEQATKELVYKRKAHPWSQGSRPLFRDHSTREMRFEIRDDQLESRRLHAASDEHYQRAFRNYLVTGRMVAEERALEMTADPSGGYLVPPEFSNALIQAKDDRVFLRRLGTVLPMINADSLGIASLDNDPADSDWTSELATGSEDSTMSFGKRELAPHPLAKRLKVSQKLLRATAGRAETIVLDRITYKQAITEEKAFLTGDGVDKPLGVFTASSSGVPTSQDRATGSTTNITEAGLVTAKYALREVYRANSAWLFPRLGIEKIAKLSGDTDKEIWRPSLAMDEPDMLMGRPIMESEFVPSTFTSDLYVGMIADWSNYWIVDALTITIQRLVELYAETNQIGFIARSETDGQPTLAEAFVRLKCATS